MSQITDTLLMVRPVAFRMNEQTAVNNYYQEEIPNASSLEIQEKARKEFDDFVDKLREVGVRVIVVEDTLVPNTPDSIFPNNWISFHENGNCVIYPMFAENRRLERRTDILDILEEEGFEIKNVIDYTSAEDEGYFLEGTGSLLLDRENQKVYCALSPRADEELVIEFCEDFDVAPVIFNAFQTVDGDRKQIYHTNVMMALAEKFAVICLDSIDDKNERKFVAEQIRRDGREIIAISEDQVNRFAGNMLQVIGGNNERYTVMSESAFKSLTVDQIDKIEASSRILYSDLNTIETAGGGSARCMMAEVFLPKVIN